MDFVPVYETRRGGRRRQSARGVRHVQVGAERIRLAGIQSAPATRETIRSPVRAAGVVVPDESASGAYRRKSTAGRETPLQLHRPAGDEGSAAPGDLLP